ncbi:MAG: hypothetical protein J2P18_16585 [Nocardia sp.]|nr:hypothetical protein [Nocardia sp.]
MKRFACLVIAFVVAASVFDYAKISEHRAIIMIIAILVVLQLVVRVLE